LKSKDCTVVTTISARRQSSRFSLVNDRLKIGGQQSGEGLLGLVLQLKAIYQKKDAPHVAGSVSRSSFLSARTMPPS
jgi:hypothetical protein